MVKNNNKSKNKSKSKNKTKSKKQFLYNPDDPKKSFYVYIDKDPMQEVNARYEIY